MLETKTLEEIKMAIIPDEEDLEQQNQNRNIYILEHIKTK